MERIKIYALFGLAGFSLAGFFGVAKALRASVFSFIFSLSTIYYFLSLFITYIPILLLVKFIKTKSLKGIGEEVAASAIYSFMTLGALISISSISYLIGGASNVLIGVIFVMYVASLASMKIAENTENSENTQP